MVTIGRRANGALVICPILLLVYTPFVAVLTYYDWIGKIRLYYRARAAMWEGMLVLFLFWIDRLIRPKVLVECDKGGVWLYARRGEMKYIRWREITCIRSHVNMQEDIASPRPLENVKEHGFLVSFRKGLFRTGTLRIDTAKKLYQVPGVYYVARVERELERRKDEWDKRFLEEIHEEGQVIRLREEAAKKQASAGRQAKRHGSAGHAKSADVHGTNAQNAAAGRSRRYRVVSWNKKGFSTLKK